MNYTPNPIDTSDVKLPEEILALCEKLAENTHEVWAKGRMDVISAGVCSDSCPIVNNKKSNFCHCP